MRNRIAVFLVLATLASASAMAAKPVPPPPQPTVSGMKVYAAGQPVGYVLSMYHSNYGDYLTIISETGYLADFFVLTGAFLTVGQPGTVYYTSMNCTAEGYSTTSDPSYLWKMRQGMVFRLASQAYYSSRGETPSGLDYYSQRNGDGSCGSSGSRSNVQNVVPVFPNDVSITGIPSDGLTLPVVFGIP